MEATVPGTESYGERKVARTFLPGSERAGERIGQDHIGRFAPGSELARERKGSVPYSCKATARFDTCSPFGSLAGLIHQLILVKTFNLINMSHYLKNKIL